MSAWIDPELQVRVPHIKRDIIAIVVVGIAFLLSVAFCF
jgi:hypothetical protein